MSNFVRLGIDIGSTTVKVAIIDENEKLLFSDYRRHFADIQNTLSALLKDASDKCGDLSVTPMITGSGGLTLANHLGVNFVQEVVCVSEALSKNAPQTDVAIELGGEDAKIIYFENGNVEQRMNGICAGGTGSFIDQMAGLIRTDATGLNEYAKGYKAIYPIAARCGVFAKTDIQPLINEGATREDLSASIFQAVVNQTISGLACGKPIRGHVTFLGGPLHFLDQLRESFIRTLKLDEEHTIIPENSHLFAAMGAAICAKEEYESVPLSNMVDRLSKGIKMDFEVARLEPLFKDEKEFDEFNERHAKAVVKKADLATYKGDLFLGIDAGSTTTKIALISEDGTLLESFYSSNNGNLLQTTIDAVKSIYSRLPEGARIARSCSTGYGEALLKSALMLDEGEVETIAHYTAASFFQPECDCILDIGGQDMKCIKIKNGVVDSVLLNEACSSGCGSFIETFAISLNLSVQEFAKEALFAKHPIDLGTRCTVIMNSKVKQAQKEGASVADISSGLAYSVIKNALFKLIKISSAKDLGEHVVVQGGTFYNNAVLRAFEKISGVEATRCDIAGIMGAFGAALIARDRFDGQPSTTISLDELNAFTYSTKMTHCKGCTNSCLLTINQFGGGRNFITGNRCEKGIGGEKNKDKLPNLYDYKYNLLFDREILPKEDSKGVVGIPRVLNLYENYPYWHAFFTKLGFSIELSPRSERKVYERGIESIPSESECYPAKLAHGHIQWLIDEGKCDFIWYPCIPYERNEFPDSNNHYNCPIVTSYAENIKNNVDDIKEKNVRFLNPFMAFSSEKVLTDQLVKVFAAEFPQISSADVKAAAHLGWEAQAAFRADMYKKGEETLKYLEETGRKGIVLAGRPYHVDPEINHGIPELINQYGMAVLTEDSISNLASVERPLIVMDQWMFHSRMYAAANFVKTTENLNMIQLNSFGCGLDAVTTDCVADILTNSGKIYTCLKIDEVNNLGAARIRVRSLLAAIRIKEKQNLKRTIKPANYNRRIFTKEMKENYTILCPQMSPVHFDLLEVAFNAAGYNLVVPNIPTRVCVDTGLRYVNNDACYPSLIVVGQLMAALESGAYDMTKTAVMISQTGGGCRASNYIGFIRRALEKMGYPDVPVISLNISKLESNPGFKLTPTLIQHGLYSVVIGDIFMKCVYATRPYEKNAGDTDRLHEQWKQTVMDYLATPGMISHSKFKKLCRQIIRDFDAIERLDIKKPRVGIVGEILVKFLPAANNDLAVLLESEGAEAVVPDLTDFLLYCFHNNSFKRDNLGTSKKSAFVSKLGIYFLEWLRSAGRDEFVKSTHFTPSAHIEDLAKAAQSIVSVGNQTGEGWFLTGEMLELIENNVPNIVCIQPFGCLPNHVVGKGVIKKLRHDNPKANIVAIDYDPGASEVNQLNRIKLMLSSAVKNMNK